MSQFLTYRGTVGRARVAVDSSGRAGEQAQEVLPLRKPQTALTRVNGVTKASYSAFHRLIPAILAFHSALIVRFSPAAFERVRQRPMRFSGPSAIGDSHLRRVGLDLMAAHACTDDDPNAGPGRAAERHRRSLGSHPPSFGLPWYGSSLFHGRCRGPLNRSPLPTFCE